MSISVKLNIGRIQVSWKRSWRLRKFTFVRELLWTEFIFRSQVSFDNVKVITQLNSSHNVSICDTWRSCDIFNGHVMLFSKSYFTYISKYWRFLSLYYAYVSACTNGKFGKTMVDLTNPFVSFKVQDLGSRGWLTGSRIWRLSNRLLWNFQAELRGGAWKYQIINNWFDFPDKKPDWSVKRYTSFM